MFKRLMWIYYDVEPESRLEAETPFGYYNIIQEAQNKWVVYSEFLNVNIAICNNLKDAKNIANQDYHSRLSSTLDKYGQRAKGFAAAKEFADGGATDDY